MLEYVLGINDIIVIVGTFDSRVLGRLGWFSIFF